MKSLTNSGLTENYTSMRHKRKENFVIRTYHICANPGHRCLMKGMEMDSYVVTNRTIDNVLASWIQPWNYQPTWKEISLLR
jgi:hypothetical protein